MLHTTDTIKYVVNGDMLGLRMFFFPDDSLYKMRWTFVALALTYIDHKRELVKFPLCSVVTEEAGLLLYVKSSWWKKLIHSAS